MKCSQHSDGDAEPSSMESAEVVVGRQERGFEHRAQRERVRLCDDDRSGNILVRVTATLRDELR